MRKLRSCEKKSEPDNTRIRYDKSVLRELEKRFAKSPFIYNPEKKELASQLNITSQQLQRWFVKRRVRERKNGLTVLPNNYARKKTMPGPASRHFKPLGNNSFRRALTTRNIKRSVTANSSISKEGTSPTDFNQDGGHPAHSCLFQKKSTRMHQTSKSK